jgi:hypothetical protein
MIFLQCMVWSGLSGNIGHIDCIILVITSIYGIQDSRISRLHLSLFTVYKRVLHIIKLARYYIDMRIIFWIIVKRDRFFSLELFHLFTCYKVKRSLSRVPFPGQKPNLPCPCFPGFNFQSTWSHEYCSPRVELWFIVVFRRNSRN